MENKENTAKKEQKMRSRLYPRYDLEEAVNFISVVNKLGGTRVSAEAVAADMSKAVNNSTFIGRVSSAKQFGLLAQESGKLSLSSVGKEIVFPRTDAEKKVALKTAFATPTLYKELIDTFRGKTIPDQAALGNRLVHDYGIEAAARDTAARNFVRSAEYAAVIQNGILLVDDDISRELSISPKPDVSQEDSIVVGIPAGQQAYSFNDTGTGWSVTIKSGQPLDSKIKKALVDVADSLEQLNKSSDL